MIKKIKEKWEQLKAFEFEYELDFYIPPYIVVSVIVFIICVLWIVLK